MARSKLTTEERLARYEQQKNEAARKAAKLRRKLKDDERAMDTRRKIIAGGWLIAEAERNPAAHAMLARMLAAVMAGDREADQRAFEGWALPPQPNPREAARRRIRATGERPTMSAAVEGVPYRRSE